MPFYEMLPGGMPAGLQSDMDAVLNKKWGTSTTYPPEDWPETVNLMGPLPERTVSGSIVTFPDGADDVPLKSCAVTIAPTLDGISSVDVVSAGKNLFDGWAKGYGINTTTGEIQNNNNGAISGYIPVKENTDYYITGLTNTLRSFIAYYKSDKTFISRTNGNDKLFFALTTPAECAFIIVYQYVVSSSTGTIDDIDNLQTQVEYGTQGTTYTTYVTPTTYTAALGRTIYGGSVDVVNGTGTADSKMRLLSSLTWTVNPNYAHTYNGTGFTDRKTGIAWNDDTCKSDKYIGYSSYTVGGTAKGIALSNSGSNTTIYVSDEDCPTLQDFLDMLQTEDSKVTLPLATPEDFTFTAVPMISRLGDNTLWSEQGDLSVTYRRDIDLALAQ